MPSFLQNLDASMVAKMQEGNHKPEKQKIERERELDTDEMGRKLLLVQADTTKCWNCTKKVGLLGFNCKCSYIFCSKHRAAESHRCTFDYRKANKEKLEQELKPCVGEKMPDRI